MSVVFPSSASSLTVGPRRCIVLGGGGFLGSHLVKLLLDHKQPNGECTYSQVRVFDRQEFQPLKFGINPRLTASSRLTTFVGDLRYPDQLKEPFQGVDTVFHLASVVYVGLNRNPLLEQVNVGGVQNVLNACWANNVRYLIYTSSTDVVLDKIPRNNADEESCTYPDKPINEYIRTKIEGEKLVLKANGKRGLLTCALRPCHLYGPGDPHAITHSVRTIKAGQLPFIPGDGSAKFGIVYIDNIAHAHILAADSLASKGADSPACGNAYFIREDNNINFFKFIEPFAESKGAHLPRFHLPFWALYFFAVLMELVHWLVSKCVRNFEPTLSRFHCYVIGRDFNFVHHKAARDLGYQPIVGKEEGLRRTLAWFGMQQV